MTAVNGSYTVTRGGESRTVGQSYTELSDTPYILSATPDSGYTFSAWVDGNGKTISTDTLSETVTKKPVTKKITVGTKERPPTVGDGKFSCPIHDRFHKTTGFQMRWGRFHKGVDLACPTGTPVYAADGGTVVTASYKPSYGNLVEIDHQNGYLTKYAHNSKILVNVGDKVYEGQKIALVGSTGNSTGPHCHFEVRYHDDPKNPLNFITLSH